MNLWTREDISKILIQLDKMNLPFSKYALCQADGKLKLLGRGGSAEVFEAQTRASQKQKFAMKVIGFRKQNADSDFFNESVQVQMDVGDFQNNVVKIYDHAELWITLDDKDNVVSVVQEKPESMSGRTIKLQFVLMEKLTSVITRTKGGNIRMCPEALARGDEQEILKLAYDVGLALKYAHNKNILHRDVKLENVFYSEKRKRYKLGDFGIAKKTEDGFAGTVAFTKGYAAPEVRVSTDRYDNTADIYSFGIMLYVLANGLKFPDSNTYNVNLSVQYEPGYIVPEPEFYISEELYLVIAKACMYDADQRYQSMDELLLDIEKLMYDASLGYKKEHKNTSLVVGTIMFLLGVVAWKLTMAPEMIIKFSFWEYIFLAGCLGKGILKILKKNVYGLSIGTFFISIYLIFSTGFSWVKLILFLMMVFSSGMLSGYLSAWGLLANIISLIQQTSGISGYSYSEYSWVAITVVSLSLVLLYQYEVLALEDRKTAKRIYKKGFYWILICLIYAFWFLSGFGAEPMPELFYTNSVGYYISVFLCSFDRKMVGLYGLAFCAFWVIREKLLIYRQNKLIQRMNEQYENEYYE